MADFKYCCMLHLPLQRIQQWLNTRHRKPMALHVWSYLFLRHIIDIPRLPCTTYSRKVSYTQTRPRRHLLAHCRMLLTRYAYCTVRRWSRNVGMDNLCICMAVRLCWHRSQFQEDGHAQLLRNSLLRTHGIDYFGSLQAILRLRRLGCYWMGYRRGYMLSVGSSTLQHTQGTIHAHSISHLHHAWRHLSHGCHL